MLVFWFWVCFFFFVCLVVVGVVFVVFCFVVVAVLFCFVLFFVLFGVREHQVHKQ